MIESEKSVIVGGLAFAALAAYFSPEFRRFLLFVLKTAIRDQEQLTFHHEKVNYGL